MPDPTLVGTRSATGSIKILFQKLISQDTPFKTPYPVLAIADVADDGTVNYIDNRDYLRREIARSETQSILLYIHGILGDTVAMARSSHPNQRNLIAPNLLRDYDLILTFDYENLNTRIQDVASDLKQRLADVGLGADHGKTLHIVAHSMGGLVSRWFIEREKGNQVVQKLVMLGTPNGGSPWPSLQDWAFSLLGIGLNGLSGFAWPAEAFGSLLGVIESGDVTLDQMMANSDFLRDLKLSGDPNVPYYLLAGNTSLMDAALQITPGESTSPLQRLLQKLRPRSILHDVAGLAFWHQPNDIASSVASVSNVPMQRNPVPNIQQVASDHVSYFMVKSSLDALKEVLEK